MEELYRRAKIRAQITGEHWVNVRCENISGFTLSLKGAPVDLSAPVTIEANGVKVFSGRVPSSGEITLCWDEATGRFSRPERSPKD